MSSKTAQRKNEKRRIGVAGNKDGAEAAIIIVHLVEQGYHRREINRLIAMYNDHLLSPWRAEHLESRQPVPAFDVEHLLDIAQRGGYDWMLKEEVEWSSSHPHLWFYCRAPSPSTGAFAPCSRFGVPVRTIVDLQNHARGVVKQPRSFGWVGSILFIRTHPTVVVLFSSPASTHTDST